MRHGRKKNAAQREPPRARYVTKASDMKVQKETAASICLLMVFDASRPRCKLAVREELQILYFLANTHKDMML
jgi:hypothetical protein